jgi:hypothetical protein
MFDLARRTGESEAQEGDGSPTDTLVDGRGTRVGLLAERDRTRRGIGFAVAPASESRRSNANSRAPTAKRRMQRRAGSDHYSSKRSSWGSFFDRRTRTARRYQSAFDPASRRSPAADSANGLHCAKSRVPLLGAVAFARRRRQGGAGCGAPSPPRGHIVLTGRPGRRGVGARGRYLRGSENG